MFVDVICMGRSPLLLNRMTEELLLGLRKTGAKTSKTKPKPEKPRDEAEPKLYVTKSGDPFIPTENLFSCLVAAGQMIRLDGKRQMSTAKSTLLPAYLALLDPFIPLLDPDHKGRGTRAPAWEVDLRQGRNPNGGEAVCLVRPRFDRWSFRVSVEIDENEIGEHVIRELFDKAGSRVGLGDYRPSRKGPFGRFRVDSWTVVKDRVESAAE